MDSADRGALPYLPGCQNIAGQDCWTCTGERGKELSRCLYVYSPANADKSVDNSLVCRDFCRHWSRHRGSKKLFVCSSGCWRSVSRLCAVVVSTYLGSKPAARKIYWPVVALD